MENPLVSVVVVTFNSAKTVLETLESIKAQTYQNIELIVSDDCSKDNTINVCREWINTHSRRFRRIEVVTVSENRGVPANLNRAERACHGEWVKSIAGDDLLEPTCISDYIDFIKEQQNAFFLFGKVSVFGTQDKNIISHFMQQFDYNFFNLSRAEQLNRLIKVGNCIPAPSFFYNLTKKNDLKLLWDERIPLLEDYPMWINALNAGVNFYFIDKIVARYRVGAGGIVSGVGVGETKFKKSWRLFTILYLFNYRYKINEEDGFCFLLDYMEKIDKSYQNSKSYRLGKLLITPFNYLKNRIKRWF